MPKIQDISDKGRKGTTKKFRYEVGVFHTQNLDEEPDIIAKFRKYGDARSFAENGIGYWVREIIIRS